MAAKDPTQRALTARIASESSWAQTEDRSARTAKARAALEQKWLEQAGGDPVRATHLRKAHFARMTLASVRSRRKARELIEKAEHVEAELRELGGAP